MLDLPAMQRLLISEAGCDDRSCSEAIAQELFLLEPLAEIHVLQRARVLQQRTIDRMSAISSSVENAEN